MIRSSRANRRRTAYGLIPYIYTTKNNTMKKLFLLLLIAPVFGYGQVISNPVSNAFVLKAADLGMPFSQFQNIVVPDGKVWTFPSINKGEVYTMSKPTFYWFYEGFGDYYFEITEGSVLPEGTIIWADGSSYNGYLMVNEHNLSSEGLSFNNINKSSPTLYPNPTSSLLALNSDKEYDIEVYDMAGNKVMALTGNTIDMSHLSSATYIVKALDKVDNEEVSYKVVKN